MPWMTILLVLAALYAFIQIANEGRSGLIMYNTSSSNSVVTPYNPSPAVVPMREEAPSAGATYDSAMMPQALKSDAMIAPAPGMYPYPGGTPAVTDTREFNKIYYNATMRTRDVPSLTKLVETTVRGNGGRVDQISSSEKSGSVRFVVPQSKFDGFRDQIEKFVDSRFLTVNIDSQNLLPQKQSIEKRQDYTKMSLDQLNASRKSENADYSKRKAGIQEQIDANDRENTMLDKSLQTVDVATRPNIVSRQMQLYGETSSLKNQLSSLEKNHLNSINGIDAQIRYTNGDMDALKQQDQNLAEDVATVSGTISINWVSLWEIVRSYLPGYWIPGILLLLAIVAHWLHRPKNIAV